MCEKCNDNLKLISYKWDEEDIICTFKCIYCENLVEIKLPKKDAILQDMLNNSDLYKKYDL